MTPDEIRTIFREELENHHQCRFNTVDDADAIKVGGYINSIATLGDGDVNKGVALMIDNHKWISSVRVKGDWASRIAFGLVITAVVGAAIVMFIEGMKLRIRSFLP